MIYYKYLNPVRTDVLEHLKIRYTQVTALNDPFESLLGLICKDTDWYLRRFRAKTNNEINELGIKGESKKKQYFRRRKKDFPNWYKCYTDTKWLTETSEEIQNMVASVSGILSLSATNKNVLMWSHYARNHEGFVIGFDGRHEYFGKSVEKVIYSETRPYYDPTINSHEPTIFNTKSIDWAYEQEYRKSMPLVEQIKLDNGNKLSPFNPAHKKNSDKNKIFLFDFPMASIHSIILGWKSDSNPEKKIMNSVKKHELDESIIKKAYPHETKFEMKVE
jgi:hypothetical protein